MLEGIKYSIDKIKNKEQFQLAKIGQIYLLSPITNCIIFYSKLCGVPKLQTENDVNELWFRLTYLRRFGFAIYTMEDILEQHPLEPFYNDLEAHIGLELSDVDYVPRKQWINKKIDLFIENCDTLSNNGKVKYALKQQLDQRELFISTYIAQETNIDFKNIKNPNVANQQTQQQNPSNQQPIDPVNPQIPKKPEEVIPPEGTVEWYLWDGMRKTKAKEDAWLAELEQKRQLEEIQANEVKRLVAEREALIESERIARENEQAKIAAETKKTKKSTKKK